MSISKRLRFEILRRDNYTCRYCGRSAPEVKLTVDHVVPDTLGGGDDPTNLVAACVDCNSGKSSVPPDASLVADVLQDAVRWKRAMEEAADIRRAKREERLVFGDAFMHLWDRWTYGGAMQKTFPVEDVWRSSLEKFYDHGLQIEDIQEAIEAAMGAKHVQAANRFRYFCGTCWRMISELQAAARDIIEADD